MMMPLTASGLSELLTDLPEWFYDEDRSALNRRLELEDFSDAFGLMTRIALAAEKLDHHPEWSNTYNVIDIWLTTHEAGGVSDRDGELAQIIDKLYQSSRL